MIAGPAVALLLAASCASSAVSPSASGSSPDTGGATPASTTATAPGATTPPESSAEGDGTAAAPEAPAGPNQLPVVTVIDVETGDEVALESFAPADKPLILWLWAPH